MVSKIVCPIPYVEEKKVGLIVTLSGALHHTSPRGDEGSGGSETNPMGI
jgi:hypothetical protein